MFSSKHNDQQFFCGHNILIGVFVNCIVRQDVSLMNCVGYNKLLFHE
jgi:hypothetical protein